MRIIRAASFLAASALLIVSCSRLDVVRRVLTPGGNDAPPCAASASGATQCKSDYLWYDCSCDECDLIRKCAANPGLSSCACPTREQARLRPADCEVEAGPYPPYAAANMTPLVKSERAAVALVMPIWAAQIHAAARALRRWQAVPLTNRSRAAEVDVVIFVAYALGAGSAAPTEDALRALRGAFAASSSSFESFRLLTAGLSAAQAGYPIGAAVQFLLVLNATHSAGYVGFVLMEPDVYAVRPFWLDALLSPFAGAERWWMRGSPYYSLPWSMGSAHINGNAFYRADDEDFLRWAFGALAYGQRDDSTQMAAYDYVMWLRSRRQLRRCEARKRYLATRFVYSDLLVNAAPVPCVEKHADLIAHLRSEYPSAYLVHASRSHCRVRKTAVDH